MNWIKKLTHARALIQKTLYEFFNPAVALSFGKDSFLVYLLVKQFKPDVPALFVNTGFEYPDTYKFIREMTKRYNINLVMIPPKHSFWWVVERHGFPLYSKGTPYRYSKKYLPAHYCCLYLKKRPLAQHIRRAGYDVVFDGLRASESQLREFSIRKYGVLHYHKGNASFRCHPLAYFTDEDIEAVYSAYKIPYCSIYDKKVEGLKVRTGCWCCTVNLSYPKMKFLRLYYPKLWRLLLKKGLASVMASKKLKREVDQDEALHIAELEPCFFDTL